MGSYFKPLRRKFGVLTLGVACLFAAGWVRSRNTRDAFNFGSGQEKVIVGLVAASSAIMWQCQEFDRNIFYPAGWSSRPLEAAECNGYFANGYACVRRWRWLGFETGSAKNETSTDGFDSQVESQMNQVDDGVDPEFAKMNLITFWIAPY